MSRKRAASFDSPWIRAHFPNQVAYRSSSDFLDHVAAFNIVAVLENIDDNGFVFDETSTYGDDARPLGRTRSHWHRHLRSRPQEFMAVGDERREPEHAELVIPSGVRQANFPDILRQNVVPIRRNSGRGMDTSTLLHSRIGTPRVPEGRSPSSFQGNSPHGGTRHFADPRQGRHMIAGRGLGSCRLAGESDSIRVQEASRLLASANPALGRDDPAARRKGHNRLPDLDFRPTSESWHRPLGGRGQIELQASLGRVHDPRPFGPKLLRGDGT